MSALVASVTQEVDDDCHANKCKKGKCSISLNDAPPQRLVVDLDCAALPIQEDQKRCDYLFIGEQDDTAWVAPIELKGGGFKVDDVVEQLQGGSDAAHECLPPQTPFRFVPVLAHGKRIHNKDLKELRRNKNKIVLRGQERQTVLLRCGEKLTNALS